MKHEEYTIDNLIDKFRKDADQYEEEYHLKYETQNPPSFNIARAFFVMFTELKKCREWIEEIHNG